MIRKYSLLSIVFLLLFAGIATAQSICTISGTLYRADGVTPAAYGQLEIIQTVKVGATISTKKIPVRADANGMLSFSARRSSSITLKGDFYGFTNGRTVNVPNSSTANLEDLVILSTVFTTAGDMVYAGANGVPTRLPIGANGRVLKVSGGLPVWAVESGGGGGAGTWGAITGTLSDQTDLQSALDAKQALDSDLTAIAALTPTNDDVLQRKAGAWTNRTVAQFKSDLSLAAIATSGSASDLGSGMVPLARLSGITTSELSATAGITNDQLAGSIAATKISGGAISNTEFDFLDGVTSGIQTQFDAKAPLASPALTGSPTAPSIGRGASVGTDQAGSDFTAYAGAGTGTGLTGDLRFQMAATGSTGSSANPLIDRQIITKRKALSDGSNVNLVTITLPTLTGAGGFLDYTAYATNGTDVQIRRGVVAFSAINKAGTYTTETSIVDETSSASTGTLSCSFNFSNGTNQTTLRANCDTSLTPTTFYLIYQVRNQSEQAMTIQ